MTVSKAGRDPPRVLQLRREGGLSLEVMDYGAILARLIAPTRRGPVDVLPRLGAPTEYATDTRYLNAVIGRFANRIDHGGFSLDGARHHTSVNEPPNTLHSGVSGFHRRVWRVERVDSDYALLSLESNEGDGGFPGRLSASVEITLPAADTLVLDYTATCDQPCPVNLTHHLYFNLSGQPGTDILDHGLRIAADATTPVRPDLIPTGEIAPVAHTPFDLRRGRRIGELLAERDPQLALAKGLDHNFVLDGGGAPQVELHCPASGLTLEISTDQPGLQVYSGQGMAAPFVKHGAIVFEPQGFPDAMNHPNFPDCILRPGQTYRRTSVYRFRS